MIRIYYNEREFQSQPLTFFWKKKVSKENFRLGKRKQAKNPLSFEKKVTPQNLFW